jgi:uncharacterized membrane protein HdeD (DUF308 family)
MKDAGYHDGYKSRKWWGLILSMAMLVWGAVKLTLPFYSIFATAIVSLYTLFSGFNLGEKVLGSGGLLNGLGIVKNNPEDTAGDEEEI